MNTKLVNPVLDFINTLCNFIVLNLIFLITCIPVFTIGAALSSLYCVTMKEARGEYGYLVRTYLQEFKKNFKSGTKALPDFFLQPEHSFCLIWCSGLHSEPFLPL